VGTDLSGNGQSIFGPDHWTMDCWTRGLTDWLDSWTDGLAGPRWTEWAGGLDGLADCWTDRTAGLNLMAITTGVSSAGYHRYSTVQREDTIGLPDWWTNGLLD